MPKASPSRTATSTHGTALTKSAPEVLQGSSNKYQVWELVDPEKWVPDGYACVRVNSRGAGRSQGFIDIWSPREARDIYDCIEWAGTQSWSTGKVGMNGISYFATNQWQVAALKPAASRRALHLGRFFRLLPRACAPRRHPQLVHRRLVPAPGRARAAWRGRERAAQPGDRRAGRGTGNLAAGRACEKPRRRRRRDFAAAPDGRFLSRASGGIRQDRSAAALRRQLGRTRPASARQFRRFSARGLPAEMAGSARRHPLHALLQQLRNGRAEALPRPFPQRRGHRLGQAAARVAQHPQARRKIHAARRERMAARAHAMDQIFSATGWSRRLASTSRRPKRRSPTRPPATASPSSRRR